MLFKKKSISTSHQYWGYTYTKIFLKYILLIMILQLSHFFLPLFLPLPCTALPPASSMSMGCTYKFFGFSISYNVLNLPLSILYLPSMLFNLCTFLPPFSLLPFSTDSPPGDLYFCDSIPVLLVCLVCFCFSVFLDLIVDSCELWPF